MGVLESTQTQKPGSWICPSPIISGYFFYKLIAGAYAACMGVGAFLECGRLPVVSKSVPQIDLLIDLPLQLTVILGEGK
jgi:hypothetical protein